MDKEYTVLKQGGLHKASAFWAIVFLALFIWSFVAVKVSALNSVPKYFISSDNASQLMVQVQKGTPLYYLNGEQLQHVSEPSKNMFGDMLDWINANKGTRQLPMFVSVFVALGLCLLILIMVNPTGYFANAIMVMYWRKKRQGELPLIDIPRAPSGIVAVRMWGITKDGILRSTAVGARWESCQVKADVEPRVGNLSGIYAFRLGTVINDNYYSWYSTRVAGIVSLSGHCVGHKDNIVRASKATIIMLVTKNEKTARQLRAHYICPITVSPNPLKSVERWAISRQGLFWMQHNNNLIQQGVEQSVEKQIVELPSYQTF